MVKMLNVSGVDLEIVERGSGQPLLFLHAGEGLAPERPWLDQLAKTFHVIAPWHPGFGRSALPEWIGTVDDLSYLYLDLAAKLGLENAVLVGSCFGGWVAAEMAVRNTQAFSRIVLTATLGIKVRGRDDRDIADMHSMTRDEFLKLAWANPDLGVVDLAQLPEAEVRAVVQGREALTLFGWKPYMHNPRLKRWLHRIDKPTRVLWGDKDRIVTPAYGEAFAAEIPGARFHIIHGAGHFPHWEKPEEFARLVAKD